MATTNQPGDPVPGATETVDPSTEAADQTTQGEKPQGESQTGQPTPTPEGEQAGSTTPEQKPEEPSFNKDALLADLHKERGDRKTAQAQVEQLTAQLATAGKATEQLTAVQRKYDRLEQFLIKAGGPLGKALDSKSFTEALFGSDEDVEKIAAEWRKANPTATSVALGGGAADPAGTKPSVNELLRAAASS